MKDSIVIIVVLSSFLLYLSCGDNADENRLTGSTDIPAQVANVTVENLPGRAVIRYELPDDINMKYVKATYVVDGVTKDVNASFYTDTLLVEGFPDAGEYLVNLYSISYGGTESEPVVVKVNPTTPPYKLARKAIFPSFSGMRVTYENDDQSLLSIGVIKKMENNQWVQIYMQYNTTLKEGEFSVRGQKSVPSEFGVFVRDRWGHVSDTIFVGFIPWYEEECDKSLFKNAALPTDEYICHKWGGLSDQNDITMLWNGTTDRDPTFQTRTTTKLPQHFTINLGRTYQLSRFTMHSRYYVGPPEKFGNVFDKGHPRVFEIWGSVEPGSTGNIEDGTWTKIASYESVRPSGMTTFGSPYSEEDKEMARKGEEFMIPEDAPSVRYIRFRTLDTWSKTVYIHLHELTFFGSKVN